MKHLIFSIALILARSVFATETCTDYSGAYENKWGDNRFNCVVLTQKDCSSLHYAFGNVDYDAYSGEECHTGGYSYDFSIPGMDPYSVYSLDWSNGQLVVSAVACYYDHNHNCLKDATVWSKDGNGNLIWNWNFPDCDDSSCTIYHPTHLVVTVHKI